MNTCKNKPTELFRSYNGVISYSKINEDFIIQYSNLLLRLEPSGFLSFREFVYTLDLENFEGICENDRCFILKMPTNINFVFNKLEIKELRELTSNALGIFKTLKMAHNCLNFNSYE